MSVSNRAHRRTNVLTFENANAQTQSGLRPAARPSRLSTVIVIGLGAAVVFSALAFGSVEAWAMAIVESIGIVLTGLWITESILTRQLRLSIPAPLIPVAGLVCWGLIQSIAIKNAAGQRTSISMDVEASRVALVSIFFLVMLALTAANFISDRARLGRLATFLAFYGLALAVFGLIQSFTWDGAFYWFRPTRATGFGPFANRDHFAGYMEMLMPFPAALIATRAIRSEQRFVYGFAALMMVIATVASLSRGGMLSAAAEAAFITMWALQSRRSSKASRLQSRPGMDIPPLRGDIPPLRGDRRPAGGRSAVLTAVIIVAMLGAAGALGIAWIGADPIINKATQTVTEIQEDASNHISRQWIWSDTWALIKAHPLTGAGIGAYETVYPTYSHSNGRMIVAQSHNDYLQVIADCGIVGGVLMVLFLVALYRAMRRALKVEEPLMSGVAVACSAGMIGILVHSLFDFNLQIPSNALLFLFLTVMLSNVPAAAPRRLRIAVSREQAGEAPVPIVTGV
jgi:O-antigen ligase